MRKPDPGIFKLAMGIAQASPQQCIYFDDRPLLCTSCSTIRDTKLSSRGFFIYKKNTGRS